MAMSWKLCLLLSTKRLTQDRILKSGPDRAHLGSGDMRMETAGQVDALDLCCFQCHKLIIIDPFRNLFRPWLEVNTLTPVRLVNRLPVAFWHCQAESRQGGFPLATPASTAGWNFGEDLSGAVAVAFWELRNPGKSSGTQVVLGIIQDFSRVALTALPTSFKYIDMTTDDRI